MKKIFFASLLMFLALTASAQEQQKKRPHFSPEEFQTKQKTYITEKAGLTPEEAEAFFPLFFELQKKKFELERNARKDFRKQRGEKMTEEECRDFVYKMADTKIEIAKLEREYTGKYLEVLPPCKLRRVQHAEGMFQRDLMKKMTEHRSNAHKEKKRE
jgi:Spy/CpxP family protein refolding chaperone